VRLSRVILMAVVVVGLLGGAAAWAATIPPKPAKLVVSTWGFNQDLLQKNIAQAFENEYGIKIVFDFGDNAPRLARLLANKDHPVDDVVTFAPTYAVMAKNEGLLQPIDVSYLPNIANIVPWAQNPLGDWYGVGYTVQVFKLAYRTDKVKPPVTSWKDFWRSDLAGKITLPDLNTTYGPSTLLAIAQAWGGSQDNLAVGWQKLKELVDSGALLTTYTNSAQVVSLFQQGEVVLAPMPSFAWPSLKATKLPLAWVTPKEGLIGSVNTLSVVKGTPNAYWAEQFINFWLSQPVQVQEALDLVDAPANTLAVAKLPNNVKEQFGLNEDISKATFYDPAFVVKNLSSWLDQWNKLMTKK
jgi:putative spermidine/putrescine transport system substrate-binding protein